MNGQNLKLSIEKKTQQVDNFDDYPDVWESIGEEWFKVRPLTGREYEQAQAMQSNVTHVAETSYRSGMDSGLRLTKGDRLFEVESVVNVEEMNRKLEWRLVERG